MENIHLSQVHVSCETSTKQELSFKLKYNKKALFWISVWLLSACVGEREKNNNQRKKEMADWWKAKLVPGWHVLLLYNIKNSHTFQEEGRISLAGLLGKLP